jgi:hypothetical protein
MDTKHIKRIQFPKDKVVFLGYGIDIIGPSFADYGLTINYSISEVVKCFLYLHDQ